MTGEGGGKCPICTAPWADHFKPFCSKRCADVDLSRWLRGGYAIPVVNDDDDDDGEQASALDDPRSGEELDQVRLPDRRK